MGQPTTELDPNEDWYYEPPDGSEPCQGLAPPPLRPAPPRRSSTRARAVTGAARTGASAGGGGEVAHTPATVVAGAPAALGSAWAYRERGGLSPLVVVVWRDGEATRCS